jgi:SLT domain-containing protein
MLSSIGLLESAVTGQPTQIGAIAASILGPSTPQRTRQTLQRTFNEFLTTLEEAINSELQHSLAIFALFEAIDHQFLNLARTVVRENAQQDEAYADLLSSLWTRILGARAADVAKYERNRQLLASVRERTVRNKGVLVEHNHKLLALKANLEALRRRLVSPLVRSQNSSTLTLGEQVRGLEDVAGYLEGVRRRQKGRLMEVLYGSNSREARRMIEDPGSAPAEAAAATATARWV